MAGYTSVDKIKSYYMGFDPTTSDYATSAQVQEWIDGKSATVDTVLRTKYILPITNANDLAFIKNEIVDKLVVGVIDGIMRMNIESNPDRQFIPARNYTKEAEATLRKLADGDIILETSQKSRRPISYRRN